MLLFLNFVSGQLHNSVTECIIVIYFTPNFNLFYLLNFNLFLIYSFALKFLVLPLTWMTMALVKFHGKHQIRMEIVWQRTGCATGVNSQAF